MITGCYTIHLYCKFNSISNCKPATCVNNSPLSEDHLGEFIGETASECRKKARKKGWKFTSDGDVVCPLCVKAKK